MTSPLLRPSDRDALAGVLRDLHSRSGFDVMFGGITDKNHLHLSAFAGTCSTVLRNLVIIAEKGVGGRAIAEQRPVAVQDYSNARSISHDYDLEVAAEGIQALLAVPVVVRGQTRATMYGGLRSAENLGDRASDSIRVGARWLEREIEIRDEVDRRISMLASASEPSEQNRDLRVSEAITESYLALSEIAASLNDEALSDKIASVELRLRALTAPQSPDVPTSPLSQRETTVLSYVAVGCSNAEIAQRMTLSAETVKTYMRNIMRKLGVGSRHEAVVEGRRQGFIP